MKISDESMKKASALWEALLSCGVEKGKANMELVGEAIGVIIEESWQQGFSDCEMAQRIKKLRGNRW